MAEAAVEHFTRAVPSMNKNEIVELDVAGPAQEPLRKASLPMAEKEELQSAFEMFNQISQQLSNSYSVLEDRVGELTEELSSVSAQRAAELLEKENIAERLESLLNVLPGGVVVIDEQGLITQANPAAREMLGEALEGELWRRVIQRCFAPRNDDGHEVSTLDGRRISIATRSLIENGQIVLLTDQTETRRLQDELNHHERLSSLGKMVSALAHQIRTPLSAAMLYAGHLCDGQLSDQQQQDFSGKVLKRLNHMERQVQDMLMFVKGELPLNDVLRCDDFQQQLEEETELLVASSGVVCHWRNDCPSSLLRCHKDALIGALLNLVNNSVQASEGIIELSVGFSLANDGLMTITVIDNGPGIDASVLASVKEVFVTTKAQGTGLGLAVVDSVARRHGGDFTITSTPGEGTVATLSLPIPRSDLRAKLQPQETPTFRRLISAPAFNLPLNSNGV